MSIQQKHINCSHNTNKLAGFWIRFIAKGLDVILLITLTIIIAWGNISIGKNVMFKGKWNFYVWSITTMFIWPLYFICLPLLTNGQTIGTYLLKIKIKFNKFPIVEIIKREMFFSLIFSLNFLLITIFINHTLANKFFQTYQDKIEYKSWENFRRSIPLTVMGAGSLFQICVGITIIVKKGQGYNDSFSNTNVIYIYKYTRVDNLKKEKLLNKYKPRLVRFEPIEWIK